MYFRYLQFEWGGVNIRSQAAVRVLVKLHSGEHLNSLKPEILYNLVISAPSVCFSNVEQFSCRPQSKLFTKSQVIVDKYESLILSLFQIISTYRLKL